MERKKVQLAYIADASARRVSFSKRRRGLLKKVTELSTLCAVNACVILYGPYDPQPYVCPSQPEAHRVLMRFKSLPAIDQYRNANKQLNQESFTRNRIQKINEHVIFTATNASEAVAIGIPNHSTNSVYTNVNVGVLDENESVVNHHNQDCGVIVNDIVGQEMMASDANIEALLNQSLFMDVIKPPSVLQSDIFATNNQMTLQGGVPPPSYNDCLLEDINNNNKNNNAWMMAANNYYVPMNNNIYTTMNNYLDG
ncbi:hypothetical protein MKX01_027245 [Papaver californicum]|nr:hypothetical protein MKX01_027245 [Papaver californicum]